MMDEMDDLLKGRLLVATPVLVDDNFARTVVLVLEHERDGALGVVLNRPLEVSAAVSLPAWSPLLAHPPAVFSGGPVSPEAVICLGRGRSRDPGAGWNPLLGDLGTVDLSMDPDQVGGQIDVVRVFSGYSGWDGGQLEAEVEAGGWFVVEAEPRDVFTTDPSGLWRNVLRRQPGRVAMFATFPDKPSSN